MVMATTKKGSTSKASTKSPAKVGAVKKAKSVKPWNARLFIVKAVCFLVLVGVVLIGIKWTNDIERYVNHTFYYNNNGGTAVMMEDGLTVHFIDVGQADAICVQFPNGKIMMVDTGNSTSASIAAYSNYLDTYIFNNSKPKDVIVPF